MCTAGACSPITCLIWIIVSYCIYIGGGGGEVSWETEPGMDVFTLTVKKQYISDKMKCENVAMQDEHL